MCKTLSEYFIPGWAFSSCIFDQSLLSKLLSILLEYACFNFTIYCCISDRDSVTSQSLCCLSMLNQYVKISVINGAVHTGLFADGCIYYKIISGFLDDE